MRRIDTIIVHHSAGNEHATVEDMRALHVGRNGWSDIGYHYVIHRDGEGGPWLVRPGRPVELVGAHDGGQNVGSIGVCIAGRYHRGPVDSDGWETLVRFVTQLCRRYGLDTVNVEGHNENEPRSTPTACPGFSPSALRLALAEHL